MKKRVIITGASAGIGEALSKKLSSRPDEFEVIGIARRKDRLKNLESSFKNFTGFVADINQPNTELQSLFKTPVDILVNNAGLALGTNNLETTSEEDWKTMFETNVFALVRLTQWALPGMRQKKSGDILNVGSIAGYQTYPGGAIYNATKFAVRAITEALRKDVLGHNIRVMGIHPGMVNTEFSQVRFKGDLQKADKVYEGMRALTATDIADTMMWMIDQPSHICIESLRIMPTDQAAVGYVHRD